MCIVPTTGCDAEPAPFPIQKAAHGTSAEVLSAGGADLHNRVLGLLLCCFGCDWRRRSWNARPTGQMDSREDVHTRVQVQALTMLPFCIKPARLRIGFRTLATAKDWTNGSPPTWMLVFRTLSGSSTRPSAPKRAAASPELGLLRSALADARGTRRRVSAVAASPAHVLQRGHPRLHVMQRSLHLPHDAGARARLGLLCDGC